MQLYEGTNSRWTCTVMVVVCGAWHISAAHLLLFGSTGCAASTRPSTEHHSCPDSSSLAGLITDLAEVEGDQRNARLLNPRIESSFEEK